MADAIDILSFGDVLIDFTPLPDTAEIKPAYEANVGGTSANLATAAARLGAKAAIAARAGNDDMGRYIERFFIENGVDTSMLDFDGERFTTLTFVTLRGGERSFSFCRRYAADHRHTATESSLEAAANATVTAISGMGLTDEPARSATLAAADAARAAGKVVAMDLNYRASLWSSEGDFVEAALAALPKVDILKGSEEEAALITNKADPESALKRLAELGVKLAVVSLGDKGAIALLDGETVFAPAYDFTPVDTTGAGDCFMAALLTRIARRGGLSGLGAKELGEIMDYANAAGGVSVTARGGASSAPTAAQVENCINNIKHRRNG